MHRHIGGTQQRLIGLQRRTIIRLVYRVSTGSVSRVRDRVSVSLPNVSVEPVCHCPRHADVLTADTPVNYIHMRTANNVPY